MNQSFLEPLDVRINPEVQEVKQLEQQQIKELNDDYTFFTDKVSLLPGLSSRMEIG